MYDGTLKFDTKIDSKGFIDGIKDIKKNSVNLKNIFLSLKGALRGGIDTSSAVRSINSLKNVSESAKKSINSSFKSLALTLSSFIRIWQLVNFGRECIELGSDIAEVQNVVDTAFGDMAYKVEEFTESCVENFGMSKLTAKQMSSTFMAMANGMGQGMAEASDKAIEITGRLGDVASFYNKTMTEVDTIGRAVYTGETEPLKAIGVVMTETNLKLFAMQKGYAQAYDQMSQQQKLLVRQEYFLEKTNLAAEDFVKTQDSWANQTRILSERFKELKSIWGSGLIVALKPVIKALNNVLNILIDISTIAGDILSDLFGIELDSTSTGSSDVASDYSDMADSSADTLKNTKEINKQLSAIDKLNNIATSKKDDDSTSTGTDASDSIDNKIQIADDDPISKKLSKWSELLAPLKKSLAELKSSFSSFKEFASTLTSDFYEEFLVPLGKWSLSEEGLPRLLDITSRFFNEVNWSNLNTHFSRWFSSLEKIAEFNFSALLDFYDFFLEPLAEWNIGKGLPQLLDIFTYINENIDWEKLRKALIRLWKAGEPLAEGFCQGLINFFRDITKIGVEVFNVVVPGGINALASALEKLDADDMEKIAYALALIGTSIAGIKITKKLFGGISNLYGALKDLSKLNLGKLGVITLTATLVITSFKWLKGIWKDAFKDADIPEMHSFWDDFFGKMFGKKNSLTKYFTEMYTGIGAVLTDKMTPKEWLETFAEWAKACSIMFSNKFKEYISKNKLVMGEAKLAIPAVVSVKYSANKLKSVASKIKEQLKSGDLKGAAVTIGVNLPGIEKIYAKVKSTVSKVKGVTVNAKLSISTKAKEIKESIKEKISDLTEKINIPGKISLSYSTKRLKEVSAKIKEQLKSGDLKGAAMTVAVNLPGYEKIKEKIQKELNKITEIAVNAKLGISVKAKEIKEEIKEKVGAVAEKAVSIAVDIKAKFSATSIWQEVKQKWNKATRNLSVWMQWTNKGSFISGLKEALRSAINTVIRKINSALSFKIPGWIPKYGGKTWGVNMKEIPHLATGAVIPPNAEFLAVLGDQKHGTNIEAPLDTIKQALREVEAEGANTSGGDIHLTVELDGDVVYKTVVKKDKEVKAPKGKRPVLG